ncbi:hypothetical protein [Candidatus Bathycorpusculum sp.]|uniref:hypothetical protein n=1 Tax=Candidatus Bathycorpusculum sp. TaxID=2994959 RepID=UPI0028355376|nr:hypothetical protein [Candidatus Termitimicrobium sp.]MCL2685727.1 hypothetical protein [Candidatus Termitimicrobium sp.]
MKKPENKNPTYTLDMTTDAQGDGSVTCPKCNTAISPDDETEENYEIISSEIQNGELAELVLKCSKCNNTIKLTGF